MKEHLTVGQSYDILTSRGRVEAQVVQPNVAIFASDYNYVRWHGRLTDVYVGGQLDDGAVLEIKERA